MAEFDELIVDGLTFTPIVKKDSKFKGWNSKGLSFEQAMSEVEGSGGYYTGLGLVHGTSGTCCLDIDDVPAAIEWFRDEHGIDNIMEYLDGHFEVLSPNAKTGKFMFKLPPSMRDSDSVKHENRSGWWVHDKVAEIKLEFMSGSRQDAWPGSKYWDKTQEKFTGNYSHRGSAEILDLPYDLFKIWSKRQKDKAERKVQHSNGEITDSEHKRSEWLMMLSSGENYHDALKTLSLGFIKDKKMSPNEVFDYLSTIVLLSQPKDIDRQGSKNRVMADGWKELHDLINGANKFIESDESDIMDLDKQLDAIETSEDKGFDFKPTPIPGVAGNGPGEMPWPPGLLGEFAEDIFNGLEYQYREMAIVTAVSIVAGICGRKFNISNSGLNLYFAVLAESSVGKGSIKEIVGMLKNDEKALGKFSSFFRFGGVTSGKALINPLMNARSHLRITDEAGVASLSKSGDPASANAAYLDLWPVSGKNGYADGKDYVGAEENSIKPIRSPALSSMNISTPDSYKEAFYKNKAMDTGMAARITVVNIDGGIKSNRNKQMVIRDSVLEKLRYLASVCATVQASEDPNCWDIHLEDHLMEESQRIRDEYDLERYRLSKTKDNMTHVYGRSHLKSLRYTGIAVVFNKNKEDEDCLVAKDAEFNWGVEMGKYEISNMEKFFTGKYFGNELAEAVSAAKLLIIKMMKGQYKGKNMRTTPEMRKLHCFSFSSFKHICASNRIIKEFDDDAKFRSNPISGAEKVLKMMVSTGDLIDLGESEKVKLGFNLRMRVYQIQDVFYDEF